MREETTDQIRHPKEYGRKCLNLRTNDEKGVIRPRHFLSKDVCTKISEYSNFDLGKRSFPALSLTINNQLPMKIHANPSVAMMKGLEGKEEKQKKVTTRKNRCSSVVFVRGPEPPYPDGGC